MKSMQNYPPLPSSLVGYLNNPLIGRLFCVNCANQQTETSFVDEEAGDANENTLQQYQFSKTIIKEWVLIIQYIDRVLLLIYVITLILYHT